MAKKADTVIIGGGVGGSALGALLSAKGQKVILLERNSIIGGRCASYERDGFVIDVGVHLFGLSGKGPLGEVCRLAGEPDAIEWVLARKPGVSMHIGGKTQSFSREMMAGEVDKKEMGNLANMFVKVVQMTDEELETLWYTPLLDWVSGFTKDKGAHAMFAMLSGIYFCISPDVASTAEFIVAFREVMQNKSSGYPKGGCIAIPKAYQNFIEKNGGEVSLNSPVEKIVIEDGKATGVVSGGQTIEADRIVSNADIKKTIGGLAGGIHFPEQYVDRIQNLTYTAHVVALKVALDKKITDQKMVMYAPKLSDEEMEEVQKAYMEGGPMPYIAGGMLNSPTNFDESLAPDGKQLIFFGTRCDRDHDWDRWGELCMGALEDVFPGIGEHVLWTKVDSPDTVEKYADEDGNVIGVGQTVDQIHEKRPTHETPVKNLYLVGAEAGGHGIGTELAASSAIELAQKLV
jgi:phytoene dehydrogenase-like protein